jgi:hypothetical protein
VRSTASPYTESRLTRSVANERAGFPVVKQLDINIKVLYKKKFIGHMLRKLRAFRAYSVYAKRGFSIKLGEKKMYFKKLKYDPFKLCQNSF